MVSASVNSLSFDFMKITDEISRSVNNIKAKNQNLHQQMPVEEKTSAASASYGFSLNSFAVSYLQPGLSYSIHKFLSENQQFEQLKQQNKNVWQDEENKNAAEVEDVSENDKASFTEMLSETIQKPTPEKVAKLYGLAGTQPEAAYSFGGSFSSGLRASQITGIYDYVLNINSEHKVVLDFFHQFNRNFDFSI